MKERMNRTVPFFTFKKTKLICALALALAIVLMGAIVAGAGEKGDVGKQGVQEGQGAARKGVDKDDKDKHYSVTDEMMCGAVRIEAITECAEALDSPSGPCINQKIFFINKDNNKKMAKDVRDDKSNIDNTDNEVLHGRASSWGCVKDKKNKKYIAISYGTGGNCSFCEWTEIYDLEGRLLITDYFYDSEIICADGYLNYLTGWRDYAYFKDSCKGLGKSVVNEIKKEVRKTMENSKKIVELIGKEGKFLVEMKYREITRNKYYQKTNIKEE